jgi:hypothetical protein
MGGGSKRRLLSSSFHKGGEHGRSPRFVTPPSRSSRAGLRGRHSDEQADEKPDAPAHGSTSPFNCRSIASPNSVSGTGRASFFTLDSEIVL